jgi:hypothetical protein
LLTQHAISRRLAQPTRERTFRVAWQNSSRHDERVERPSGERQRRLLLLIVICVLVVVGDIVVLNLVGEVSSGWWLLAVPVGLLLVPILGIVALVLLVLDRRRAELR